MRTSCKHSWGLLEISEIASDTDYLGLNCTALSRARRRKSLTRASIDSVLKALKKTAVTSTWSSPTSEHLYRNHATHTSKVLPLGPLVFLPSGDFRNQGTKVKKETSRHTFYEDLSNTTEVASANNSASTHDR